MITVAVAMTMVGLAIGFYLRTFSKSEEITLFDVSLFADEGLISFNIPLTRLAPNGISISRVRIFERSKQSWTSGTTYPGTTIRRPLRKSIEVRQARPPVISPSGNSSSGVVPAIKTRRDFFVLADIGYIYGDWKSEDRPGLWITLFVPVWFVGLLCYVLYLLFNFRLFRFRIRTLLSLMVIAALFTWVTHLRVPS